MLTFQGVTFALRIADSGDKMELCILDAQGEPEVKLLTLEGNGTITLAEGAHPDLVGFVQLDQRERVVINDFWLKTSEVELIDKSLDLFTSTYKRDVPTAVQSLVDGVKLKLLPGCEFCGNVSNRPNEGEECPYCHKKW